MANTKWLVQVVALVGMITISSDVLAGQGGIPETVRELGTDIAAVESGGYWSRDSEEGSFRLVVTAAGIEHVNHRLFLQWIKNNIDDGTQVVVSTVSIDEINSGQSEGYVIDLARDKDAKFGTLRVKVSARRERSNDKITYELTADGRVGRYKLTKMK